MHDGFAFPTVAAPRAHAQLCSTFVAAASSLTAGGRGQKNGLCQNAPPLQCGGHQWSPKAQQRKDDTLGGHNGLNAAENPRTVDVTTSWNSRRCAPKKHKCFSLEASITRCD